MVVSAPASAQDCFDHVSTRNYTPWNCTAMPEIDRVFRMQTITWNGREMTPQDFLTQACRIDTGDYVELMSTLSAPFWERGVYEVPDNWWRGSTYVNVPLDTWFDVIVRTMKSGGSLVIGGDVSEPGINGFEVVQQLENKPEV